MTGKTAERNNKQRTGGSIASDAVMRHVPRGSQPIFTPASTNRFVPPSTDVAVAASWRERAGLAMGGNRSSHTHAHTNSKNQQTRGSHKKKGGSIASDAVMRHVPYGAQPVFTPASTNRFVPPSTDLAVAASWRERAGLAMGGGDHKADTKKSVPPPIARRTTPKENTKKRSKSHSKTGGSLASDAVMRAVECDALPRPASTNEFPFPSVGGGKYLDEDAKEKKKKYAEAVEKKKQMEKKEKAASDKKDRIKKDSNAASSSLREAEREAKEAKEKAKSASKELTRRKRAMEKAEKAAKSARDASERREKVAAEKKKQEKQKQKKSSSSEKKKNKKAASRGGSNKLSDSWFAYNYPPGPDSDLTLSSPHGSKTDFMPEGSGPSVLGATGATMSPRNFDMLHLPENHQHTDSSYIPFSLSGTPMVPPTRVDLSKNITLPAKYSTH